MPYTIEPPSEAPAAPAGGKYTIEPPSSPSFGERLSDFGGHVLSAGKKTLEESGLMPPLHATTAQEYRAEHPDRGQGFLGKTLEAAKGAVGETLPMMNLALGPGVAPPSMPPTVSKPPLPASGISVERADLAKEARDVFKIPVSAPQIGMSNFGKIAESASRSLPFSGARAFEMAQRQAFNRAVAEQIGENANVLTQTVMDNAKRRIGSVMDRIENSYNVNIGVDHVQRLGDIEHNAIQSLSDNEAKVIQNQIENIFKQIGSNGQITGDAYGKLLRRDGPLDQAVRNNNSNISNPTNAIADVLRDALHASLPQAESDAYRLARFQYKNLMTIESLAEKAPIGDISPSLLNTEVTKRFPDRAYKPNPLDRLAKIGQAFLKDPATSTTSERYATMIKVGEVGGAAAAGDIFGMLNVAIASGGTLAANRVLSAWLRSRGLADKAIEKALAAAQPVIRRMANSTQALRMLPGSVFGQTNQSDTMRQAAQPVPTQP